MLTFIIFVVVHDKIHMNQMFSLIGMKNEEAENNTSQKQEIECLLFWLAKKTLYLQEIMLKGLLCYIKPDGAYLSVPQPSVVAHL